MKSSPVWPLLAYRILALLFGGFLLLIIFAANLGIAGSIFGRVYNFPYGDKFGHFGLYGMLGLLAGLGFPADRASLAGLMPLKSSLVIAALVTLEEISQIAMSNRTFDLLDLIAGLVGIFLFGEIGARLTHKFHPLAR